MEPSPILERLNEQRKRFLPSLLVTEALGCLTLVLVVVWTAHSLGGFAWDGSAQQFNWHPLLMTIGMVLMFGNSIVIYRAFNKTEKIVVKIGHTVLHTVTIICVVIGLKAVFDFHNAQKIPNLYSLHSWMGLGVVILFFLQFGCGFVGYMYPKASEEVRASYMPVHRFVGVLMFAMVICTVVTGINEKLVFLGDYANLPSHAIVGNLLGVCVVLFSIGIGFLVINPNYSRDATTSQEYHPMD